MAQQPGEHGQGAGVQHRLRLLVGTGHDVADGAQGRGLRERVEGVIKYLGEPEELLHTPGAQRRLYTHNDGQLVKAEQLHKAGDYPGLHDHLDAVIGAVGQVRQGPARVSQHLPVIVVQQADQSG